MGRGKRRCVGGTTATAARSTTGRRPYRPRPPLGAAATRDWVEHATIVFKLHPRQGTEENESGFTIAKALDEATGHEVTLKGPFGPVEEGQLIAIKNDRRQGKEPPWRDDRYGQHYLVWSLDHADPVTRLALESYLRNLPGVGDVLAPAIIDTFSQQGPESSFDGSKVLAMIDAEPSILKQVRGAHGHGIVGDVDKLIASWESLRGERKEMLFLSELGLGDSTAKRVRKYFREQNTDAVSMIKANPYVLTEVSDLGFRLADLVGRKNFGIKIDDPRRITAGIEWTLERAEKEGGHICLTREMMLEHAPRVLALERERPTVAQIGPVIDQMIQNGQLVSYTDPSDKVERLYTKELYIVETRLYESMQRLLTAERLELPKNFEPAKPAGSPLTDEQWAATMNVFSEKLSILTGGPGVGKCVVGGTKVLLNGRRIEIRDAWEQHAGRVERDDEGGEWAKIVGGPLHTTALGDRGQMVVARVTRLYRQRVKETGRSVLLDDGSKITMTEQHRLHGSDGWQRELEAGDYVALPGRVVWEGEWVDQDLATLLAWQISEGYEPTPGTLVITQAGRAKLGRVRSAARRFGNRSGVELNSMPIRPHSTSEGSSILCINSVAYCEYLEQRGYEWGHRSALKQIPEFMVSADAAALRTFIREYAAAEGSVSERDGILEITSASRELLEQLRVMLLRFGIAMRIRRTMKSATNGTGIKRRYYQGLISSEALRLYSTQIGIADAGKQKALDNVCERDTNSNLDVIPSRDLFLKLKEVTGLGRQCFGLTSSYMRGERDGGRDKCEAVIARLDEMLDGSYSARIAAWTGRGRGNYHRVRELLAAVDRTELQSLREAFASRTRREVTYTKVKVVDPVELDGYVYDLEVATHHNYVANGIVTHNTTTLSTLISELEAQGQSYFLLAPTGKAAKRMREQTGRDASTIHRRLGGAALRPPTRIDEPTAPHNVLDVDVIVVDEASMLDARLSERLLSAASPHTRFVLVGDPDQLPPVGAGAVLLDLLAAERVPTTTLTQVFRQAENSLLIVNAHRLKDGLEPYWTKAEAEKALGHEVKEDWKLIETGSGIAARDVVEAEVERLAAVHQIPVTDVMVASPFRKGEAGVWKLNQLLQNKHNPHGLEIRGGEEKPIRVGDVVMNTKNRYVPKNKTTGASPEDRHDVMNGDTGKITEYDAAKKVTWVDFGESEGPQPFHHGEEVDALIPAYAATIHKLQGSQAPALVAPLVGGETDRLISRNHIYTAWTRAEEECVVVVDEKATLIGVLGRKFERETTLDLRVGRIEKRLKAAWEQVRDFEERWNSYTKTRSLPRPGRKSGLAA